MGKLLQCYYDDHITHYPSPTDQGILTQELLSLPLHSDTLRVRVRRSDQAGCMTSHLSDCNTGQIVIKLHMILYLECMNFTQNFTSQRSIQIKTEYFGSVYSKFRLPAKSANCICEYVPGNFVDKHGDVW